MTTQEPLHGAVLAGGNDGTDPTPELDRPERDASSGGVPRQWLVEPIATQRSAAEQMLGGTAADPWPAWARAQLLDAVDLSERVPDGVSIATVLYRDWFNPAVSGVDLLRSRRPLAGVYRSAHIGSGARVTRDGVIVVDRHDVIGRDGWWRTWGESWTPPRTRPGSVRVLFTPRPDRLADFVRTTTAALVPASIPWSLGCATNPRRMRRFASAVLDLPSVDALPAGLLDDLAPALRPVVPPLCLPLAAGVAVAEYPENGMTYGEHRCHLIALALRHPSSARRPLRAIAAVFAAHGINPAAPYRSA
ncbi:MAG: HopA1 effector protein family [Pseudonocardiales bacterium]|jgi:hypothetical protein|nr:HopA1 effector protein family [Pseudonocardiales bacterium]